MGKFYRGTEDQFKAEVLKEIDYAFASAGKYVFANFEDVAPMDGKPVECLTILIPGEGLFTYSALELYSNIINNYDSSVKNWALDYVGNHPVIDNSLEERVLDY